MGSVLIENQTYRPQDLTVYVVLDEQSDFLGPRTWFLSLDQVFFRNNVPYKFYFSKHTFLDILTWIGEFRPGNKTIWVVFYVESEFSGPRAQFLSPDRVFWKNVPYKNFENFEISCFSLFLPRCSAYGKPAKMRRTPRINQGKTYEKARLFAE